MKLKDLFFFNQLVSPSREKTEGLTVSHCAATGVMDAAIHTLRSITSFRLKVSDP